LDKAKLMKQVRQGSLHVVVAGRLDGTVGFLFTREPMEWLATLGSHFDLGEIEVRATAAAEKIVKYLRSRFAVANVPSSRMPWYLIDFAQAIEALDGVNLQTGEPESGLKLHAPVYVNGQRGTVFGFTNRHERVVVKLDGLRFTQNLVIARREDVKPVVRVMATSTGGKD
jgi:hypothetical protein